MQDLVAQGKCLQDNLTEGKAREGALDLEKWKEIVWWGMEQAYY